MNKLLALTAACALACTSLSFAGGLMKKDASCVAIAKACKSAGFSRGGDKKFWQQCMHPALLGQTVKGLSIDPAQVKSCRDNKIAELQQQLQELQSVK